MQRAAGIENIVHQQHIPTVNVDAQFLGENQIAGFRARAVARYANEIQA